MPLLLLLETFSILKLHLCETERLCLLLRHLWPKHSVRNNWPTLDIPTVSVKHSLVSLGGNRSFLTREAKGHSVINDCW